MRRAAALAVVLLALALVSGLLVGGAYVTRQLRASGSVSQRAMLLEPLVESALVDAIAGWDTLARSQQTIGAAAQLSAQAHGGVRISSWITRLSERTFWLVAETAREGKPPLNRRLGVVVRLSNSRPELVPERSWGELP